MGLRAYSQESSVANLFKVDYETPLTIEMKERQEEVKDPDAVIDPFRKKERKNPKVFWGIKTKRGYTRKGFGDNVVVELFHYMKDKDYVGPDTYDRDFYWYDFKKKKIVNSLRAEPKKSGIMHGHYIKKIGDQVLEEGYFYKGKKHGRWVRLNKSDILQDKKIYWKGWPEESLLSFYDFQRTKVKEVIPVHYGERQGTYYAFHPNGEVAAVGDYMHNQKVGLWREFYPNRRIKREIRYPDEPFAKNKSPYIVKEYADSGGEIYDRSRFFKDVD
jgi:antitoxin component YwqK of YwqJK toxin-antitoxin module